MMAGLIGESLILVIIHFPCPEILVQDHLSFDNSQFMPTFNHPTGPLSWLNKLKRTKPTSHSLAKAKTNLEESSGQPVSLERIFDRFFSLRAKSLLWTQLRFHIQDPFLLPPTSLTIFFRTHHHFHHSFAITIPTHHQKCIVNMPKGVKTIDWTAENDAKLLLTIIAIENVSPNYEKVAAAFGKSSCPRFTLC